jgi:hypothetical protein
MSIFNGISLSENIKYYTKNKGVIIKGRELKPKS